MELLIGTLIASALIAWWLFRVWKMRGYVASKEHRFGGYSSGENEQ